MTSSTALGLDFGIVTGSLIRTEARYDDVLAHVVPCRPAERPRDPLHTYCGFPSPPTLETNAYDEERRALQRDEESVPPVFALPMLPHLALRYEPMTGSRSSSRPA